MHRFFEHLTAGVKFSGKAPTDVEALFVKWGRTHTLEHCVRVSREACQLAERFSINGTEAEMAGLLHDISNIVPRSEMVALAESLGLDILPEERVFPGILHQKLSAEMASQIFRIESTSVLGAIGCHTTLKRGASSLDKAVFLADKIQWDQPNGAPFGGALLIALDRSLDDTVICYLNYLWERRSDLGVLHPWMVEAREELMGMGSSLSS